MRLPDLAGAVLALLLMAVAGIGGTCIVGIGAGAAFAQALPYPTLASRPDPRDFVSRTETRLTLLGDPLRFIGYDIGWLGFKADGSPPASPPSTFEVNDELMTVQQLDGTVVRTRPLLVMMCASCGAAGRLAISQASIASLDLLLETARNIGLKVIVPLVRIDRGSACADAPPGGSCDYLRARGLSDPAAFFTDVGLQADLRTTLTAILDHLNTLTGILYRDDPTILAWQNCDACAGVAGDEGMSSWSEGLGQALKAADPGHLYESSVFAGRIGEVKRPVPPRLFATAAVDIVGDVIDLGSDAIPAREKLAGQTDVVTAAGKVHMLDSIAWAPPFWKNAGDLETWLTAIVKAREITGGMIGRLVGHADRGGYLPPPQGVPASGVAAFYFPGITTADMQAVDMQMRGRALRRSAYAMADTLQAPAYMLSPSPTILAVSNGMVTWRGAAGALNYSVERSPDPGAFDSWTKLCDHCATDAGNGWKDTAPPHRPAWYRVIPSNINGHTSVPSEPVQDKR